MSEECPNHPHDACYCRERNFKRTREAIEHLLNHNFRVTECAQCNKAKEDLANAKEK